jgi:hypothetical protein
VAQNHRSPGSEVVDVAVAIGIGEVGALGTGDKRRCAAYRSEGPDRRVDSTGKVALGALLEGLGMGVCRCGGGGTHDGFSIEGGGVAKRLN